MNLCLFGTRRKFVNTINSFFVIWIVTQLVSVNFPEDIIFVLMLLAEYAIDYLINLIIYITRETNDQLK